MWDGLAEYAYYNDAEERVQTVTRSGPDELLSVTTMAEKRFMALDALGSITAVFGGEGNVERTIAYDVYGLSEVASEWGFAGRPAVSADHVALRYNRARVYDTSSGVFLQRDPLVSEVMLGHNTYAYGASDPVNMTDPLGTTALTIEGACAALEDALNFQPSDEWIPNPSRDLQRDLEATQGNENVGNYALVSLILAGAGLGFGVAGLWAKSGPTVAILLFAGSIAVASGKANRLWKVIVGNGFEIMGWLLLYQAERWGNYAKIDPIVKTSLPEEKTVGRGSTSDRDPDMGGACSARPRRSDRSSASSTA